MKTERRENQRWTRAGGFLLLACSLTLPFFIQKASLDASRGGWRPDLPDATAALMLPALALPLIVLMCLPIRPLSKFLLFLFVCLSFIAAFTVFSVSYACNNYGYSCI